MAMAIVLYHDTRQQSKHVSTEKAFSLLYNIKSEFLTTSFELRDV